MIIAQIATIPERACILKRVLRSLVRQVDEIRLAVAVDLIDDDKAFAADAGFLKHPKIKVTYHDNSLQDGAKFINAPLEKGHHVLVCDDDIEYPANFAESMVKICKEPFKDHAILTVMGKNLAPRPVPNYFKSEIQCFKTFEKVKEFAQVEIPGTCGMVYCTDNVVISVKDMLSPNSDLCVGAWAHRHGVRCYVIPHGEGWLRDLTPDLPAGSPNMFDRYKDNDSQLTEFINKNL